MSTVRLILNAGHGDFTTDIPSGRGTSPAANYVAAIPNEGIDVLSRRVYGYDTPESRDILRRANDGTGRIVRVPKL